MRMSLTSVRRRLVAAALLVAAMPAALADPAPRSAGTRHELTVIDTAIAGWQALRDAAAVGTDVLLLDASREPLAQINEHLRATGQVDAVHIVSHGSPGFLLMAGRTYSSASLEEQPAAWAELGRHVAPGGDILLYGCEIAQYTAGQAFIAAMAAATGADVAASLDATGNPRNGGDWKLESATGRIEASQPLAATRADFVALLAARRTRISAPPAATSR